MNQQISEFQEEQFAIVCERMADGETLSAICKEADTPSRATFLRWVKNDTARSKAYQLARQAQADFYFDQIKDIAFDSSEDALVNQRGTVVANHEFIGRSRVKVDALKWIASKLDPVKFGDRMPEAIAAREMELDAQNQLAEQNKATRVERIILQGVRAEVEFDDNGKRFPNSATALRERIAELEAQLAGRGEPLDRHPALLTQDPGPLPSRADRDIASQMLRLIKDYVRRDQRPPETVLDEVLSACRKAMLADYGPGEPVDFGTPPAR